MNDVIAEERTECICPPSNLKIGSIWVIDPDCPRHGNQSEYEPDEQREQDWYAHGDYLGDLEREEG